MATPAMTQAPARALVDAAATKTRSIHFNFDPNGDPRAFVMVEVEGGDDIRVPVPHAILSDDSTVWDGSTLAAMAAAPTAFAAVMIALAALYAAAQTQVPGYVAPVPDP